MFTSREVDQEARRAIHEYGGTRRAYSNLETFIEVVVINETPEHKDEMRAYW